jgi:hypothetical protein
MFIQVLPKKDTRYSVKVLGFYHWSLMMVECDLHEQTAWLNLTVNKPKLGTTK